jgi:UDP-N-acetyl-L-fucosamine synthase
MIKSKLKVMTIVGTRPEIIRLSRTMALLDQHLTQVIVHTGQNYDYELNEIFWKELELRKPDHFMNVDTSSLGSAVGDIIRKSEEVMKLEKPDAVLVLGDTNSCLAAYMAKRMHIPIFHMEAGNRCFDENVPEETNRKVIDHIADFNLVYTEHARRHLLSEGLPHRRIYLTGSPMKEVIDYYKPKIDQSDILSQLSLLDTTGTGLRSTVSGKRNPESGTPNPKPETEEMNHTPHTAHLTPLPYFLVSVHREENVDNPENLKKILIILNRLAEQYGYPVIVSTHPRTRKRLEANNELRVTSNESETARHSSPVTHHSSPVTHHSSPVTHHSSPVTPNSLIQFLKPFGFLDYVHLQQNAVCTISDSGTISEESAILDFPAVSLRNSMERPEAQDAGTIILTGFDPEIVLSCIETTIEEFKKPVTRHSSPVTHLIPDYSIPDTSWRVLKLIMGNTKLSNLWNGVSR